MTWMTIVEAIAKGNGSKAAWSRRTAAGVVPTKEDGQGRKLVWIAPEREEVHRLELEAAAAALAERAGEHRQERERWVELLAARDEEVRTLRAELEKRRGAAAPTPRRKKPRKTANRPMPATLAAVLDDLTRSWKGSIRSLEREAGVPRGFIAFARKGLRSGPNAAASWDKLRAFLERLSQAA